MKLEDIPRNNPKSIPEDFFEKQAGQILKKTTESESWHLPGTKNIESYFLVPEGFWFRMEESIRKNALKPEKSPLSSRFESWKPGLAFAFSIVVIFVFTLFWNLRNNSKTENWHTTLEEVSDSEIIAYVVSRSNSEIQETTEKFASGILNESDLISPDLKISEEELEENLEQVNEQDIIQNFDSI